MATWGYKLYQDDTFCEVVETFQAKIKSDISIDQIVQQMKNEYCAEIDYHIVQLAIAESLWRIGSLTEETRSAVQRIIEEKIDTRYWVSLGADDSFLAHRSVELENFFIRISRSPVPSQMWNRQEVDGRLKKGDCFWYKCKGCLYGAVVLELQGDTHPLFLVAISDNMDRIPQAASQVIATRMYTVAWFDEHNLLNSRRMHFLDSIHIEKNYVNRYGLHMDGNKSVHLTNCGQSYTWNHSYRAISFPNCSINDIL